MNTITLTGEQADWIRRELGFRIYAAAEEIMQAADEFAGPEWPTADNDYSAKLKRLLESDRVSGVCRWFDRVGWEFGRPTEGLEVTDELRELLFEAYRNVFDSFAASMPEAEEIPETHDRIKQAAALGDVLLSAGWTPPKPQAAKPEAVPA